MGVFWTIQILFFTTFFTNTRNGLATGIVGSLGYWLKQQEVARGGQPWYYYFMLGGLYEFLPISAQWHRYVGHHLLAQPRSTAWDPVPAHDLPDVVGQGGRARSISRRPGRPLPGQSHLFCRVWPLVDLGFVGRATPVAGEKMPWLMTHMALPMCVVGGWYLGRMIRRVDWPQAARFTRGLAHRARAGSHLCSGVLTAHRPSRSWAARATRLPV